jgi:DNA mismatch repair protein MutH
MNNNLKLEDISKKILEINLHKFEAPTFNKGSRGIFLEKCLGIPNSNKLTDFADGELKTFTCGESIAVTSLKHCFDDIFDKSISYDESKVGEKLCQVLFVGFSRKNLFLGHTIFNKTNHPVIYKRLAEDYEYICNEIRIAYFKKEKLNTITGPNRVLQIRTKASKVNNTYPPLIYNDHKFKDKYMAFYLCSSFGKHILV